MIIFKVYAKLKQSVFKQGCWCYSFLSAEGVYLHDFCLVNSVAREELHK